MKREIEARLLDVNVQEFINKLSGVGAEFVGDWVQMRYCYDFNPVQKNSWIRLRTNGKTTTLTIKEIESTQIDGTKELEIEVSDFAKTDEILNKLGYKARSKQENRRIRFMLDGVEIDIDMWPWIPAYVEFEAERADDIERVCEKLGVEYEKLTSVGVQDIYFNYGYDLNSHEEVELEKEKKCEEFEL